MLAPCNRSRRKCNHLGPHPLEASTQETAGSGALHLWECVGVAQVVAQMIEKIWSVQAVHNDPVLRKSELRAGIVARLWAQPVRTVVELDVLLVDRLMMPRRPKRVFIPATSATIQPLLYPHVAQPMGCSICVEARHQRFSLTWIHQLS